MNSEIYSKFSKSILENSNHPEVKKVEELMRCVDEPLPEPTSLDAIIVLGASMDKHESAETWRLAGVVQSDPHRIVGGHSRAIVARQMYDTGFRGTYLVTGGVQEDKEGNLASRARVLANKMDHSYKIPTSHIEVVGRGGNGYTLGNIQDTIAYVRDHPNIIESGEFGLLTNEWHMPRSLLMFRSEPFFAEMGIHIRPIVVETILQQRSWRHREWVTLFQHHPEMDSRVQSEVTGIFDFLAGNYKPKST